MEQTTNFGKKIMRIFCCIQVAGFDYYCLMRLIANITLCYFYSLLVWLNGGKKAKPKSKQNIYSEILMHIFKGSSTLPFKLYLLSDKSYYFCYRYFLCYFS